MTPSERSLQAERLLADPVLRAAFAAVEQKLVGTLKASAIGDVDTHHNIALSLQLLGQIERQLHTWAAEGQLEQARRPTTRQQITQWLTR